MNLNKLDLNKEIIGNNRSNEIMKMQFSETNLIPKPISYIDIDEEMIEFVSNNLSITSGGDKLKTFFFVQQRMSEFTKTWEMVDENKNVLPNFKIITRDNDPKPGTLQSELSNIPGEPFFKIGTFEKVNNKNEKITISYKMKQPYCVDMLYDVKIITNRLTLLNKFNNKVNDEFKSKQSYLVVNGRYMPIILEDIDDDSDYDLDERKIFVQNIRLKVLGHIINEEDIVVEENIVSHLVDISVDNSNKPNMSFLKDSNNVVVEFPRKSKTFTIFKSDGDYNITNILGENTLSFNIKVNNQDVSGAFKLSKYDRVQVSIQRDNKNNISKIILTHD